MSNKIIVVPFTKNTKENLRSTIFTEGRGAGFWVIPKSVERNEVGNYTIIVVDNKTGEVYYEGLCLFALSENGFIRQRTLKNWDGDYSDRMVAMIAPMNVRYSHMSDYITGAPMVQGTCIRTKKLTCDDVPQTRPEEVEE